MGAFTDALRSFIESALFSQNISSANPTHVNKTESVDLNPQDFESLIEGSLTSTKNPEFKDVKDTVTSYQEGNVDKINKFSSAQFSNVKAMASNPIGFLVQMFSRQIVKIISVIGILALVAEIVKMVVMESLKPGRELDRRFKRLAQDEVMLFWNHQEQQKLRQGFRDVRVSANPGLRGGLDMVNGNLFAHQSGAGSLGPPTEYNRTTVVSQKKALGFSSGFRGGLTMMKRGGIP